MDSHEFYLIQVLRKAWDDGKADGRDQHRQQLEVKTEQETQRAQMKRKR